MPFTDPTKLPEIEPMPGFRGKLVHTDSMTLARWRINPGATAPEHSHPHEQIVHVVEGEFELTIESETRLLAPGATAVIPPNTPHFARAKTACRVIDIFHPRREDLG